MHEDQSQDEARMRERPSTCSKASDPAGKKGSAPTALSKRTAASKPRKKARDIGMAVETKPRHGSSDKKTIQRKTRLRKGNLSRWMNHARLHVRSERDHRRGTRRRRDTGRDTAEATRALTTEARHESRPSALKAQSERASRTSTVGPQEGSTASAGSHRKRQQSHSRRLFHHTVALAIGMQLARTLMHDHIHGWLR